MKKTVVINVVGLTQRLLGEHMPRITAFARQRQVRNIRPVLPAVTCSAQSTYLTGELPNTHGVVGNGWYFKDELEVKFWRQSNRLVQAPKIWETLKAEDPSFTCANLFWWYNMYSSADYSVTPRPNYLADGRKIPDVYSHPADLRDRLQAELGTFPLFHFWGPKTSVKSSEWIARASILTDQWYNPTLTLVYLPHLDYNLQRYGLNMDRIGKDLEETDRVTATLIDHYTKAGAEVILLSEYGITPVHQPVHLNRLLRQAGLLQVREERGLELLDAGASEAFAVADHQVAHIYVRNPENLPKVRALLAEVPGVERLLQGDTLAAEGLDHERGGDLVAVADSDSWFTYYYWLDDKRAPDFARMVDIHRKPGYDPVELFLDPSDPFVVPKVGGKLIAKKLGFRTLMNVIPLKPELVKGSHGRIPEDPQDYPIFIGNNPDLSDYQPLKATDVYGQLLAHLKSDK